MPGSTDPNDPRSAAQTETQPTLLEEAFFDVRLSIDRMIETFFDQEDTP